MSEPARAAGRDDMLTVKVAGERLALPAREVAAIIRAPALTRVPNAPANLLGVANLRGVVAPIVSLAGMLGRAPSPDCAPDPGMRRVVMMDRAAIVGLMVDEVCALGASADASLIDLDGLLARDFAALGQDGRRTQDAARRPAGAAKERAADDDGLAFIGFMLDGQEYALPLESIIEILKPPAAVTPVAGTGMAMMGVMTHRGGLLPLVSARVLLGLQPGFDPARTRVVVTRLGGALVGLTVDSMTAMLRIPTDAIDPVPPVLSRGRGDARIEAIGRLDDGRRLVAILSPSTIFDAETAARIAADGDDGADAVPVGEEERGTFEQFVVFRLGDEFYGLPLGAVEEVVRIQEGASQIPRAPDFVAGMMNLRGNPLPLIDQRRRFSVPRTGQSEGGRAEGGRAIVVAGGGLRAGLIVDAVSQVLTARASDLRPGPEFDPARAAIFDRVVVTGTAAEHDGRMILIVDPEPLLSEARRDMVAWASAEGAFAP